MESSKRRAGSAGSRTVRPRAFRPGSERLEERALLSAIDLINIAGTDNSSTPGPYGVVNLGPGSNSGVGYSAAEVGDVNGDGFDDYVVGAPTIVSNTNQPTIGNGNGQAYLIFGSQSASSQSISDWLNLNANGRIGDLSTLGNTSQFNPVTGLSGFPYNGLTFFANQNPNSLLGTSVAPAGDVNGDGFADFLMGAPQALDINGSVPGTGRAYLVYGGSQLATRVTKQVDLDNTTGANDDLNIVTFVNTLAGAFTGASVGVVLNPIGDANNYIAIGAPNASINGLSGNGAVYLIAGSALRPASTKVVDLSTVGQTASGSVPGLIFVGANATDQLGSSVGYAGDFNNDGLGDLLMGATGSGGPGRAYLIYGSTTLLSSGILSNSVVSVNVNRVITGASNQIPGAEFDGTSTGDRTGFAVASAADFNADGINDIMIGSPGWSASAGRVSIIMGQSAALNSPNLISGQFSLDGLGTAGLEFVEFDGAASGALTGWSLSPVGKINTTNFPIAIGAPGFNNTQGTVYVIPANPDLVGVYNLTNIQSTPIQGTVIALSQPGSQNFLGASVSGNVFFRSSSGNTVDGDSLGDLIIGASSYNPISRQGAGASFVVEGAFLPLSNPVTTTITSPIGVGKVSAPFVINPTTPDDLTIYILSKNSNTTGFTPPADINPDTITVNGIDLPDPSTFQDVGDVDGDGIDDASFIFSPRSLLGLALGTATITVNARTLDSSPFPNRRYTGSASVTVSTGGGSGGGLPSATFGFGPQFQNLNAAAPRFGERLLPSYTVVARSRWKPLPAAGAYRQFIKTNFAARQINYSHPGTIKTRKVYPTLTLGSNVFTRAKYKNGVHFGTFKFNGAVVNNGLRSVYPTRNPKVRS